jgi:hypothetical protein
MNVRRPHIGVVLAILLLPMVAACGSSRNRESKGAISPPSPPTSAPAASTSPSSSPPTSTGPRQFVVTSFDGCRGDGVTDCYQGMQAAIDAAQSAGGGTVYFPAGRFADAAGKPLKVEPGAPITLAGASEASSVLVAKSSHSGLLMVRADHVVVENMTFDSSSVSNGIGVVGVSGSYTTMTNCRVLGGPGTSWPLRFAGGKGKATPTIPTYATGNAISNIVLVDSAPQRNDGFDFSFQENASITNVTHTGSRLGLYVDRDVTVTNYHFTPRTDGVAGAYGYYITPPSTGITITGFTTTGNGGVIGAVPASSHRPGNIDVTIVGEEMLRPGFSIDLGDATNLTIRNSHLDQIVEKPHLLLQGVLQATTSTGVEERRGTGAAVNLQTVVNP